MTLLDQVLLTVYLVTIVTNFKCSQNFIYIYIYHEQKSYSALAGVADLVRGCSHIVVPVPVRTHTQVAGSMFLSSFLSLSNQLNK